MFNTNTAIFIHLQCFYQLTVFYCLNCLNSSSREERKIDLADKIKMMEGGLVVITVTVSGEVLYIIDATIKDQSQFRRSNQ